MATQCPSVRALTGSELFNASDFVRNRWEDTPKEDRERLRLCWGYTDCGDCHRSDGHCGWCAISSTCLPLPLDGFSRTFPLLSPIKHKGICAMGPERFELRTRGLGCQVSTITFLTSLVTIFSTLLGLLLLYGLVKFVKLVHFLWQARAGGWIVYANGSEGVWVRSSEGWGRWWRRLSGRPKEEEVLVLDDGTAERSKSAWWRWGRRIKPRAEERRPLLS